MKIKTIAGFNPAPASPIAGRSEIDYIDTAAVVEGRLGDVQRLSKMFPSRAQREIHTNDILISSVRPNLKHNYFVDDSTDGMIASSGFIHIRVKKSSDVSPRFLYYYLTSPAQVQRYIKIADSSQSAYPSFNKDVVENIELPEIDLPTQLRIAGILGSLDEKIELNRRKIAELEALAGVAYNQHVATNQCEYSTISAVATVKTGKQDSNFSTADGEYRFFTCSKDILWCDKYEFEGKAILLTGNGDLHVRYFDGKFNAYQRTYVLQPNDARLFSSIYFAVRAMLIRLARSASGSIVKFITKGDVEHIKVPAFKEQHQKLLNDCLSNVLNIEQEIDALIRIRDKLLPLLMNGQVVVK